MSLSLWRRFVLMMFWIWSGRVVLFPTCLPSQHFYFPFTERKLLGNRIDSNFNHQSCLYLGAKVLVKNKVTQTIVDTFAIDDFQLLLNMGVRTNDEVSTSSKELAGLGL